MPAHDDFARTLYDIAPDFQWIRMLGWSDDDLRRVPIHEEAPSGGESMNLSTLGVSGMEVSDRVDLASADARGLRNIWVYHDEVPADLWGKLQEVQRQSPAGTGQAARDTLGGASGSASRGSGRRG